ncbi:GNAT family N-acetyltransferase [Gammaproteobacteria bacterium]|nr:GNAT family N-acetyltransferase [Gammaproteobacteria bacterium]
MWIETKRLRIVPFEVCNITDRYVHWLNDPAVVKYSRQRRLNHTEASCLEYLEGYQKSENLFLAIYKKADIQHIGNITANFNDDQTVADLGILVGEKMQWCMGYGLEAWIGLRDYLFRERNVLRITAGTLECNRGMIAVAERSGMVQKGCSAGDDFIDGVMVDGIFFEQCRSTMLTE